MATFKETSESLDLALKTVAQKKDALDKASNVAAVASNEYNDAMNVAQSLRQQLMNSLSDVLPSNENVRIFGG